MAGAHSKFSASAAHRWLACPGSVVLSEGKEDKGSKYAAWGTVAHDFADRCLNYETNPADSLGGVVEQDGHIIVVDQEMVDCVNTYLANVREMTAGADLFQSETRTNYSHWLQVPEDAGWGTADATAVLGTELQVHDLKTGQGVEVDAKDNEQLMLYAGGKLREIEELGLEIETIRLVIHQPRLKAAPSEWSLSRDELVAWLTGRARSGAASVQMAAELGGCDKWEEIFLDPGESQCKFCKAKATCPALRAEVAQTVFAETPASPEDFEDMRSGIGCKDTLESVLACERTQGHSAAAWLAAYLSKVDLIEDWCSAVRAEALRRLEAGEPVPGFKLVQGKRGARKWADEAQAEAALKTFRLKVEEMYDLKLISPTSAEKLTKGEVIGPRQWTKLQALIVQPEGKPSVAPESDKRPAITVQPVADAFDNVADDIC